MRFFQLRHDFLIRRKFHQVFADPFDAIYRCLTGHRHWPPYSLRAFVGSPSHFATAGQWFLDDFRRLKLLRSQTRILDIGCGCGRIASELATDQHLEDLNISYTGMDVDHECVRWCGRNITPLNDRFRFDHIDSFNPSYNPEGGIPLGDSPLPYPAGSFDLIVATSVFTHLLPADLERYFIEASRLLAPGGVLYASFFLLSTPNDEKSPPQRHAISFPFTLENCKVSRLDSPADAVAYNEQFILDAADRTGLEQWGPIQYGSQDILLLMKPVCGPPTVILGEGWHELEEGRWRWTEPRFTVLVQNPRKPSSIRLRFTIPGTLLGDGDEIAVFAKGAGCMLPSVPYLKAGEYVYTAELPTEHCIEQVLPIEFHAVRRYKQPGPDPRKLGLQILFKETSDLGERALNPISIQLND